MFNNKRIRFRGTKEVKEQIRNQTENVVSRRFMILIGFIIVVAVIFGIRLYITQIYLSDYYDTKLEQYSTNTFQVDALRGEITDRNYTKLVYNKNVVCATYYAVKNIKDAEIKAIVRFLTSHCDVDISSVTTREKKDYLIMKSKKYVESLISTKENKAIEGDDDYDTEYYNLELKKITKAILKEHLSDDDVKYYKLYYAIKSCTSGSAVLLEGISIKEASIIGENNDLLRGVQVTTDWKRAYKSDSTLRQTLGKVTTKKQGLPATLKDELLALDYNNDSRVGTSGLEQQYEDILSGNSSTYVLSYDSSGNPIVSEKQAGANGKNIQLTIDWEIQTKLGKYIENFLYENANQGYQDHIYCVLISPKSGDIIAMVGKQYNHKTHKVEDYAAGNYLSAYRIGSTMKAAVVYTCFKNHVIQKNHIETDTAAGLKIKGTNAKHSWNLNGLGTLNEVSALAYSSNIYMMKIIIKLAGGTYRYGQSISLNKNAFTKLRNGAGELGLGVKTGLDVPSEALGFRGSGKNAGNLLDFAIGQYDTYTNMQLATYATTLANKGVRIQPHLYLSSFTTDSDGNKVTLARHQKTIIDDVSSQTTAFKQIQKGMRAVITYGTVHGSFAGFKYKVSGKTGTAEDYTNTGNVDYPNHLFIGYGPSDNPTICVSVLEERLQGGNNAPAIAKKAFSLYFEKYGYKE